MTQAMSGIISTLDFQISSYRAQRNGQVQFLYVMGSEMGFEFVCDLLLGCAKSSNVWVYYLIIHVKEMVNVADDSTVTATYIPHQWCK